MKFSIRNQPVILLNKFNKLIVNNYLENKSGWKIDFKIALIAFSISLFFAFPSLWLYFRPDRAGRLFYQMLQAENPLNRELPLNVQILSYRFFVPTLNYFLGLRSFNVILIPLVSSFFNIFLVSRILRTRTKDLEFTLISVIGISFTWFIVEGASFWGTTDSVAHLLLLIPAAFKVNPIYFVFAVPFSLFVDERAIFALLFLYFFLIRRDIQNINNFKINIIFTNLNITQSLILNSISMFLGVCLWLIGRFIIDAGILAPEPDISIVTDQLPNFSSFFREYWFTQFLNYLSSFRWFYFYPVFLLAHLYGVSSNRLKKEYGFDFKRYFGLNFIIFLFYSSIVMINGDVWRSMAFTYFFILETMIILHTLKKDMSININYWITFLMIITPVSFFGLDLTPQISFPMPLVLLRTYAGLGESFMPWFKELFKYVPS